MAATAGVGPQATQINGTFAPTVSIQNVGPGDVYLGSDGSLSKDNGWLLPAGAMGTWSGGSQLWACTGGGRSALRIADSALSYFTPGPDHVTIDGGTVTIGNASVPITGTVNIGTGNVSATISGPVSINGSTVNVGNAVTLDGNYRTITPGVDVVIKNGSNQGRYWYSPQGLPIVTPGGATVATTATGGNLQTIDILTYRVSGFTSVPTPIRCDIFWLDPVGNQVAADTCSHWADGGLDWVLPVKSQYFAIQWSMASSAGTFSLALMGSGNAYPRSYKCDVSQGAVFTMGGNATQGVTYAPGDVGFDVFDSTIAASDTGYSQLGMPSRSGLCSYFITLPSTSNWEMKQVYPLMPITAASATVARSTANVTTFSGTVLLAEAPTIMQIRDTSTTASKRMYGSLSWVQ